MRVLYTSSYDSFASGRIRCDQCVSFSVCVCVCVPVCLSTRMSQKLHVQNSRIFQYTLPVAVARSSFNDIAMLYVLPVLWMTPCFHTVGPMCQNQARRCFIKFARWRHPGEVAVYDCRLVYSVCTLPTVFVPVGQRRELVGGSAEEISTHCSLHYLSCRKCYCRTQLQPARLSVSIPCPGLNQLVQYDRSHYVHVDYIVVESSLDARLERETEMV